MLLERIGVSLIDYRSEHEVGPVVIECFILVGVSAEGSNRLGGCYRSPGLREAIM